MLRAVARLCSTAQRLDSLKAESNAALQARQVSAPSRPSSSFSPDANRLYVVLQLIMSSIQQIVSVMRPFAVVSRYLLHPALHATRYRLIFSCSVVCTHTGVLALLHPISQLFLSAAEQRELEAAASLSPGAAPAAATTPQSPGSAVNAPGSAVYQSVSVPFLVDAQTAQLLLHPKFSYSEVYRSIPKPTVRTGRSGGAGAGAGAGAGGSSGQLTSVGEVLSGPALAEALQRVFRGAEEHVKSTAKAFEALEIRSAPSLLPLI